MRSLLPADAGSDVDLETAYRYPALRPGAHWLRANMVSSVDGAAVDERGGSRALSGPADRRVLSALRRIADVIVVGAGTVRADPAAYRPVRSSPEVRQRRLAAGQAEAPLIAIVTASLDLDLTGEPFRAGRPLLVTAAGGPPDRVAPARRVADVAIAGAGPMPDPAAMVQELVGRGLPRILCEGGPRLLGAIAAAGLLDELCLTVSPTLAGPDERSRILTGAGSGSAATRPGGIPSGAGAGTAAAQPMQLAHVLEDGGYLFARYLRAATTG
ncbi:MAG TPA: dihydrofolate reductase family protein [Actinomycetes bacterium]|jgi:riboflavin biosynthesis pyrimidine reductase|nr:dihydrofolate reductase family protein [Actinomycetes bacterium]